MSTRVADLTHNLDPSTPVYPGDLPVEVEILESTRYTRQDGRRTLNNSRVTLGNHCGTHLDAPFHFYEEGKTIDQIDLDQCAGRSLLIRLPGMGPRAQIEVQHLSGHRAKLEELRKVVLETGWSKQWGRPEYFSDHPVIAPAAADFLVECGVHLVGLDVPSVDVPPFPVHLRLLGHGMVILENLTNLAAIKSETFHLVAAPLKSTGRDASPVRAIALEVS
jgi:arylformamidase